MSPLPKHLRPRYRYLVATLETWPDASVERDSFRSALASSVRSLFGDAGMAEATPRVIRFSYDRGAGYTVVRTRREAVNIARAGMVTIPAINEAPIAVCVRGISGTVRACEEKYLQGRQLPSAENNVTFEGADRPAIVRGTCVDVHLADAFVGATDLDLTYT